MPLSFATLNRTVRQAWSEAAAEPQCKALHVEAAARPPHPCVKRQATLSIVLTGLLATAALLTAAPAQAQQQAPETLTGTLAKVRGTGAIALGYRESSVPFSFLNTRKEPIGYSIELCRELVTAIEDAVNKSLVIQWVPVTSETRIDAVESGAVDLECGSTTNNPERQKRVSFSPTMFVAGTKVLVKKNVPIKSFRDLAGKRVAVTAGTTNEKTLRDLSQKLKLSINLLPARDHADAFGLVKSGQADAFATDDVLLHGLIAHDAAKAEYEIVRDYLSYEPYGIMYRRGDAQLGKLVNDTFRVMAEDGEIQRQYKRWFLRKLPSGESLNLPMNARLESIIQTMGGKGADSKVSTTPAPARSADVASHPKLHPTRSRRPRDAGELAAAKLQHPCHGPPAQPPDQHHQPRAAPQRRCRPVFKAAP